MNLLLPSCWNVAKRLSTKKTSAFPFLNNKICLYLLVEISIERSRMDLFINFASTHNWARVRNRQ